MKPLIGRILIAVALFAAAGVSWATARSLEQSADAHERMATLRYDAAEDGVQGVERLLASFIPGQPAVYTGDPAVTRARASYWQGRYDVLAQSGESAGTEAGAEALLLAANAAYRASQRTPKPRPEQIQQLDGVLQAYVTVLKSGRFMSDAAYNYEYVARLRDALARSRQTPPSPQSRIAADTSPTDLPSGPTIHGQPGGPPPATKGEQFQIITPLEFGDREAQPEPNPGGRPLRKG